MKNFKLILFISCLATSNNLFAHGGGVDGNGCRVQKSTGKEHYHIAKKSTKDARDVELADSKERHRKFCIGIPDVPNSTPSYDAYGKPCKNSKY